MKNLKSSLKNTWKMNQNRKDRRKYAKAFGFLKKKNKMSDAEYLEHLHKSILAGKQIQRDFDDYIENEKMNQSAELDSRVIAGLVKNGMSEAEAKKIIANNNEIKKKRIEKLARKKR